MKIDSIRLSYTVIICTFNRDFVLEQTLDSYSKLIGLNELDVELLVVDNNSTDKTKYVIQKFIENNHGVRYVFEKTLGLSHARNTGINESNGQVVIFVDDDVFFDENWLVSLNNVFLSNPGAVSIAGRVIPYFECEKPDWLQEEYFWIYGVTKYGDSEKTIIPPDIPIGCNMAFKKEIFNKVGLFDVSLGRIGKNLLSGEENAIFNKIHSVGGQVVYAPNMLVHHRIPPMRLTKGWVLKRFYWHGISEVTLTQVSDNPLTRQLLFKKAFSLLKIILISLFGSSFQPKKIYWSLMNLSMKEKIKLYFNYGMMKQSIYFAIK